VSDFINIDFAFLLLACAILASDLWGYPAIAAALRWFLMALSLILWLGRVIQKKRRRKLNGGIS
jgi:hypothetical protein